MNKKLWSKLIVWLIVLVMAVASVGMVAVAEDTDQVPTENMGEENTPVEEVPPVEEDPPVVVDPPVESTPLPAQPKDTNNREEQSTSQGEVPSAPQAPAPVVYTIRYMYLDGADERSFTVDVLDIETIEKPDFEPALEGYTFAFWYDAAGSITEFSFGGAPTKNLTLKAYFVANVVENPETDQESVSKADTENNGLTGEDDEEIFEILDEEVPLAGPWLSVSIMSDAGEFVAYGDIITLTAQTTGLEELKYSVAWRYFDGSEWHVAATDAGLVYQYTLTEENFNWTWEIEITLQLNDEAAQQADESVAL